MRAEYKFDYERYNALSELPEADRNLCETALEACKNSFAPFSNFRVGAAARLESGAILTASNQESEVLPAGLCAERILLSQWQSNHSGDPIEALAIASVPGEKECSPCGICRQSLLDTERRQGSPIRIIMCSKSTVSVVRSAQNLLPLSFEL